MADHAAVRAAFPLRYSPLLGPGLYQQESDGRRNPAHVGVHVAARQAAPSHIVGGTLCLRLLHELLAHRSHLHRNGRAVDLQLLRDDQSQRGVRSLTELSGAAKCSNRAIRRDPDPRVKIGRRALRCAGGRGVGRQSTSAHVKDHRSAGGQTSADEAATRQSDGALHVSAL